ncbi:MAG: hypothetical protein M3Y42_07840 [Actinomycetota bacterium]|nr:hypothetical protein [Actinomycetota bacterium]MDQ2956859.1 hypothetical protein [Actinomycetota bacterium]
MTSKFNASIAGFAIVAGALLLPTTASAATPQPSHVGSAVHTPDTTKNGGYIYTYYSDASHTTVVGHSGCGTDDGTATAYYTSRYIADCN